MRKNIRSIDPDADLHVVPVVAGFREAGERLPGHGLIVALAPHVHLYGR